PSDYIAASGTATFAPNSTTTNVTIAVNGDNINEPDETFAVNLSNPTGGIVIQDGQGIGTIINDDPVPNLTINDVSVTEGNAGTTTTANFTVSVNGATAQTITVDFATADQTATAGSDYTATSGTLTINPPATSGTISVVVIGDNINEPNET